jgi:hypothetical protein
MLELRASWICEACGVRCYKATGEPFPRPEGWAGDRCVSCTREVEGPEDRARRLLLDGAIVNRVHKLCRPMSKREVTAIRDELIASGELSPDEATAPKPKPKKPKQPQGPTEKQQRAGAVLREDPESSNKEIATCVGVHKGTVAKVRKRLGIGDSRALRRAAVKRLLDAEPTLTEAQVKARLRHPVTGPVIREVRAELAGQSTVGSG